MATMYELLSQRPTGKPGYRKSGTDRWDGKALESRDYTLSVRRSSRTRIQRSQRNAFLTSSRDEKVAEKCAEVAEEVKQEEVVEAGARHADDTEAEETADEATPDAEVTDDAHSFESSSAAAQEVAMGE